MTCKIVNVRGVAPGWGCCRCFRREGEYTYNGWQRQRCKDCGHVRCGVDQVQINLEGSHAVLHAIQQATQEREDEHDDI
jgi:hypothetical protein